MKGHLDTSKVQMFILIICNVSVLLLQKQESY